MRRSGHADLIEKGKACGTCHGPGSLHAASGGDPKKIVYPARQKAKAVSAACDRCHEGGEAVKRWTCAEHHREGLSCITCHDPNARAGRTLRGPEFKLCGGCHVDVKAEFRFPNRHRVDEARVQCSDCHDPHGNTAKVRDLDVRYRACVECHGEKAGPFVYDHDIKRTDGCVACHSPHGSPNRRMLSYTRTMPLCLQCHAETPHNLAEPTWSNCIDCHVEVHGSDVDRLFRR
jgi:DmsE family decaheme c-type cytochrome